MHLIYQIYFRIETQIKSNEPYEADLLNVKNEFIKIIVNTLTNNKLLSFLSNYNSNFKLNFVI